MGVSEDIALELVKAGVISAEQAPAKEWLRWKFGRIAVLEFVEKVRDHTEIRLVSFTIVGLVAASRILMVTGLNAASILAHVAEGKLRAYHEPGVSFACQNLFFDPRDLQAHIEAIKLENNWVSRERATKLLGVKDTTLAKWVKSGLLTPAAVHASAQYFDRSRVESFPADYVTSNEAAKILGVGELTVQRWARQGRLEAVSGSEIDGCHAYRFEREYLLRWRHGRLTFGQALQDLGVSNSTLHCWVKEGKIEPLKDMGGKQRWFSREAILMLRAKYVEKLVYIN
jgi:excisionase family DNA binding protein